jgi:flagellar motor switch protein FliN/FliY
LTPILADKAYAFWLRQSVADIMADETSASAPDAVTIPPASDTSVETLGQAAGAVSPASATEQPTFSQGLLRIRVPLRVTLAAQRKSIQEIIELGPGSIIKFEKTCDEPLELAVGDRPFATGEVIKVGDKFGLRIGART